MKLSVIIPAFNEEKLIPACLEHIHQAIEANRSDEWCTEIIVVDNNSTDATAQIARDAGAQVVFEPINQISRARNAGAKIATGDWFLFLDADSYLHPATFADLLQCLRSGRYAGGGCVVTLDGIPMYANAFVWLWNTISRTMKWAAGSFVFCRAEAFRDFNGFSNELYAAEEIQFSQELKRWARSRNLSVCILTGHPHASSGRKFQLYSKTEILMHCLRALFLMRWTIRSRKMLDFFYDGRR